MNKLYREQGFVILKNFFDSKAIATLQAQVVDAFAQVCDPFESFDDALTSLFANNFPAYHGAAKCANHVPALYQLAVSPLLLHTLSDFGLSKPSIAARPLMWFHAKALASTPRYAQLPAHQEWSNMQGSLNGIVAWTPLVSISQDMGRLQVIPGSHMRGLLPFVSDEAEDYPFAILAEHYDECAFVEVDVEVGDLLLFSAFLIHRSGENKTNKIRWTCNFRYNDMACASFIKRHYLNPFQLSVSTKLLDAYEPSAEDIAAVFHAKETL